MLVLVSYDVNTEDAAGRRRLRRIARHCQSWGQRVQFSVFECVVDPAQWKHLRAALLSEMDREKDSLRFYFLGSSWRSKVEHWGAKPGYDPEGPLIF
ncbi:CRISPR-associated endonuclease Cas2 [Desulfovibrio sp. SGI.169]|uniref:CRISPR-associated endonuclease Cas2 n=1 Tax=Desulfovibrio sp. SGI.169 TaxID=3420561 RepID=UPI003D061B31